MEHQQRILIGTRSACEIAIVLIWVVETFFLLALVAVAIAGAMGKLESQLPEWSVINIVLIAFFAAFASFALIGIAVAALASAIANIDTRNFHAEQLQLIRQREKHEYILPEKNRRTENIEVMKFRPERVT